MRVARQVCLAQGLVHAFLGRNAPDDALPRTGAAEEADARKRRRSVGLPPLLARPRHAVDDGRPTVGRHTHDGLVPVDHGDGAAQVLAPQPHVRRLSRAAGRAEQVRPALERDGCPVDEHPLARGQPFGDLAVHRQGFQVVVRPLRPIPLCVDFDLRGTDVQGGDPFGKVVPAQRAHPPMQQGHANARPRQVDAERRHRFSRVL